MAQIRGIDVSKYQSKIDWGKVKASGISFAIIRTGYAQVLDQKFKSHITGATKAGIDVGVYCYAKATDATKAEAEADFVLSLVSPYKLTYPICYDLESVGLQFLTNQQRTDIAIAFLTKIQNAGYYAMLYTNKDWLENKLDYNRLKIFDIWLAQWSLKPTWKGNFGIWQYGLDYVDGIGECDCNIAYKDYPSIINQASLNNSSGNGIKVGDLVKYKGLVYASSWGIGRKIRVDGLYLVKNVISKRKYSIQIGSLGWVAEKDCIIQ